MSKSGDIQCLIVGPGAVGLTIGARLQILGFDCAFLGRSLAKPRLSSRFRGWEHDVEFPANGWRDPRWSHVAIAFFAVKAFDLALAFEQVLPRLPAGAIVVPVCNGAIEHIVVEAARSRPVLTFRIGLCLFGTSKISAGNFSLKSQSSKVIWGPMSESEELLAMATESEILSRDQEIFFRFSSTAQEQQHRKWIFNVVMNSMCASRRYSENRMILGEPDFLAKVYDEAFDLHLRLWPASGLDRGVTWTELLEFIDLTGSNENSMYRDILAGRPTESLYLAGKSLEYNGFPLLKSMHASLARQTI